MSRSVPWSGPKARRLLVVTGSVVFVVAGLLPAWPNPTLGSDAEVLRPRVPADVIDEARRWANPLQATEENVEKGKAIFLGKAFCATCHGRDGRGLGDIQGLRGKLPRNFTDQAWQAARTDGELFWILKNGSPGTDMAPFIPLVLTEDEAWQVLLFVRSLGK
jgi:mono/diheme cytochrome c family protein